MTDHTTRLESLWTQLERAIKALRTKQDEEAAHYVADVARALAGAMHDAEGE